MKAYAFILMMILPGIIARTSVGFNLESRREPDNMTDFYDDESDDIEFTPEQIEIINGETKADERELESEDEEDMNDSNDDLGDDIILTPEQLEILQGQQDAEDRGIAMKWVRLWDYKDESQPGMVIIPYKIKNGFTDTQEELIRQALRDIEEVSCLRFSENNPSYGHSIEVRNSVHEWGTYSCKSWIGNVGRWTEEWCPGCQNLTINFYNNNKACGHGIGSIIHEFLHALGFHHEHARPDRDDYVSVVPHETTPNACNNGNTNKLEYDKTDHMDVTYDYCSVLHYGRGGACRITPLNPVSCNINGQTATDIGQRIGLSEKDKIEINKRYNCQTSAIDGQWSAWGEYSTCTKTCGGGTQTRTRTCSNPAPSLGGSQCPGLASESRDCNTDSCPVNGQWSAWGEYSACTKTCGGGLQTRTRTCTNPAPSGGGSQCSGLASESKECMTSSCPGTGDYTKLTNKHCWWEKYGIYSSISSAKTACSADPDCKGVYVNKCKEGNGVYLCSTSTFSPSGHSCVFEKNQDNDECKTIKVVTKSWGEENYYKIGSCETKAKDFGRYDERYRECCLPAGTHTLECLDSYGDGWHGGYLEIDGERYCEDFTERLYKKEVQVQWNP